MTDRLSTLLHDEGAHLPVPTAPVEQVLAGGRALRRRHRTRLALTAAITAVAVTAGAVAAIGLTRPDKTPEPAELPDRAAYQQLGAWAVGDEVHVGNHTVLVPDTEELQYTSIGVVVTSSDNTRTLVTPEGVTRPLDLDLHHHPERSIPSDVVATDATAPYLAYVRVLGDDMGQLTVRDLTTGEDSSVGEPFRVGGRGWVRSMWGDEVDYVHRDRDRLVNWRTGARLPFPDAPSSLLTFGGLGHGITFGYDRSSESWVVTSLVDNATVLTVPSQGYEPAGSISPDGRYLAVSGGGDGIDVYDIATGDAAHVDGPPDVTRYGWSPDGHLVGKSYREAPSEVQVCDPATGACRSTGITVGSPLTLVGYASPISALGELGS
jgi:WD40 repeat protein